MNHQLSASDRSFRAAFEACTFPPATFGHRAHVRLAYIYLIDHDTEAAHQRMQGALLAFLRYHGIAVSKYHDTMTRAWILAVRHFMKVSLACKSSDAFIEQNPSLLDSTLMMTHYSAEVLFSDAARGRFVEPNLSPIPRYDG